MWTMDRDEVSYAIAEMEGSAGYRGETYLAHSVRGAE